MAAGDGAADGRQRTARARKEACQGERVAVRATASSKRDSAETVHPGIGQPPLCAIRCRLGYFARPSASPADGMEAQSVRDAKRAAFRTRPPILLGENQT